MVTLLAEEKLGEDLLSTDLCQELGAGEGEHLPVGVLLQGGVQPLEVLALLDGVHRRVILARGRQTIIIIPRFIDCIDRLQSVD